ncbi:MAG: hypothetical protein ACPGWR_28470 [Ardenticatenaceae bacterium]
MYAIREIQQVPDRTVIVHLPDDFPSERVEVIVLPAPPLTTKLPTKPKASNTIEVSDATHRFLTMDTSHFTVDQLQAYERACTIIKQGRRPDEPRIWGVFAGLIDIADDFDAPLPDQELFWGEGSDEYGMSLES